LSVIVTGVMKSYSIKRPKGKSQNFAGGIIRWALAA